MTLRRVSVWVSILFLLYLVMPGPSSVSDLPTLPNSLKSTLEGDTIQVPNVAGYFSDNFRPFVTKYYRQSYQRKTFFPFMPLRLNYPPEFAFTAIKDQTHSTYLEEYVYPLHGSLFVNGLEVFTEDGEPQFDGASLLSLHGEGNYATKVTLRYYPSSLWVRIFTWFSVNLIVVLLWKLSRKVFTRD